MAQLTQRKPYGNNQELTTTTPALIRGMEVNILTGAGWIKFHYSFVIALTYTGLHPIFIIPYLDGEPIPAANATLATWGAASAQIGRTIAIKPGAGQHTFALFAYSTYAGDFIIVDQANMIIEEPGY